MELVAIGVAVNCILIYALIIQISKVKNTWKVTGRRTGPRVITIIQVRKERTNERRNIKKYRFPSTI
jgi:hypothetical protein